MGELFVRDDIDLYSALSAERENFNLSSLTPGTQNEEDKGETEFEGRPKASSIKARYVCEAHKWKMERLFQDARKE